MTPPSPKLKHQLKQQQQQQQPKIKLYFLLDLHNATGEALILFLFVVEINYAFFILLQIFLHILLSRACN